MTVFKQAANNASSTTATDLSASGVTSLVLASGDGAKFSPTAGGPFWLTLWNGGSTDTDTHEERVICTARSGDTLTITPTAQTHTSPCNVGQLDVAENITDLQAAVNAQEAGKAALAFKTANYTVLLTDRVLVGDATAGGFTFSLPDAATCTNMELEFEKVDGTDNIIYIAAAAGQTLGPVGTQGAVTSLYLGIPAQTIKIKSDGSNWRVI